MFVYPYKSINSGKFTRWSISTTAEGQVLIERYFKDQRKLQKLFETREEIAASSLPKMVKDIMAWAAYEAGHTKKGMLREKHIRGWKYDGN